MSAFDRLHPALQHHVVNSLGWQDLREVQELSIEAFLAGANMVVLAPTAGGKTEAAFFPVLSQMLEESWKGISVLYVSPIKALLNNQENRLTKYFGLVGRRVALWHGDTPTSDKKATLSDAPDCLLTTPESLEVMLVSSKVDHHEFFRNIRVIVIDELHAFAGDDRGWHLLAVLSRISRLSGRDLQRVGLSATVGNPDEMLTWMSAGSKRGKAVIRPKDRDSKKPDVQLDYVGSLANAARITGALHQGKKRLVFCDSRSRVEQLAVLLRQDGIDTYVSHSSLGVDERRRAEEAFAQRQNCVIVATSSLELGLDVGDLDHVIQIDAPGTVSSFLQRMGRTGRRSNTTRNCLFLATSTDGLLKAAALIELWQQGYVEPVKAPPSPYHVLAQQLMALVLQEGGIGQSQWFAWVETVPAFAVMHPDHLKALVDHLLAKGILWMDNGILAFAPEGEATIGRKNFMDLLSVFTSPPLFKVLSGQQELGYVHESTFYRREAGTAILVLAGRSWRTSHVDWRRRIAHVERTEEKGRSRWLGQGQLLSHALCQSIKRVLATEDTSPTWSRRAVQQIESIRDDLPWVKQDSTALVQGQDNEIRWWTFAGGVANNVLADNLKSTNDAVADNLSIRFSPASSTQDIKCEIEQLPFEGLNPAYTEEAMKNLKFADCLPNELCIQVFQARLNDPVALDSLRSQKCRVVYADSRSS